jgi:2-methylcitrate dehydratase PrpD
VQAFNLAEAGIDSHLGVLDVEGGFFSAYSAGPLLEIDVPRSASNGALQTASIKLDCTPHTLMTLLDATRRLAKASSRPVEEITEIEVIVPRQHGIISNPKGIVPSTWSAATSHIPYCVAVAYLTKSYLYPATIEECLQDSRVAALADLVSVCVDDRLTELFDNDPSSWPARVVIRWEDGLEQRADLVRPESSTWSAGETLAEAARKASRILRGDLSHAREYETRVENVRSWPDAWQGLVELTGFAAA